MQEMTRSDFLKGGIVAGAGALIAGTVLSGCSNDETKGDAAAAEETWTHDADVVVVGSGIGGFCAALSAQENGANVILVEVNKWTGGGSAYCGGVLAFQGSASDEAYDARTAYAATSELAHNAALTYSSIIPDWLEGMTDQFQNGGTGLSYLGVDVERPCYGCRKFFDSLEEVFADNGGTLLFETCAEHIMTDSSYANKITGLYCSDAAGNPVTIKAKAIILACGGYQGNSEMRQRYFGQDANMATIMGTPWNTGSGMMMAEELGASLQGAMGRFNSAMTCANPATDSEDDIAAYKDRTFDNNGEDSIFWCGDQRIDFYPSAAILVNLNGLRYVDEGIGQHFLPQETAKQPYATGVFISDAKGWASYLETDQTYTSRTTREIFEEVFPKIGGVVYQADSIEALCDQMNSAGIMNHAIDKKNVLSSIAEWNAAAEAGDREAISPALSPDETAFLRDPFAPIIEPPFYAWPATPCIYGCQGGVAIDTNSQVLDKNSNPIPGLYAASPTAGGIMNGHYTGAMACAASTGYLAGTAAAAEIANL